MLKFKGKFNLLLTIVLVVIFVFFVSVSAYSYVLSKSPLVGERYYPYYNNVSVKITSTSTAVISAFNSAMLDWSYSILQVNISPLSTSTNKLYDIYDGGNAARGQLLYSSLSGKEHFLQFDIWINTSFPSGPTGYSPYTYYRSTANHEFGHVLGLAHTSGSVIMNTSRNLGTIYEPKTDDINGVKDNYYL